MADYQTWTGKTVYDKDNNKIGTLADLYFDEDAEKPSWLTVKTGLFGSKVHFVPLHGASEVDGDIRVMVTEDQVKDAPSINDGSELNPEEEDRLYDHYQIDYPAETTGQNDRTTDPMSSDGNRDTDRQHDGVEATTPPAQTVGSVTEPTAAAATGSTGADSNVTSRPDGPVSIGLHPVTGKRVRLQKYIVTEMVQTTVPIQREEVRVVGEAINDGQSEVTTPTGDQPR